MDYEKMCAASIVRSTRLRNALMLLIVLLSVSCKTTQTTIDAEQTSHTQTQIVSHTAAQRHTDSTAQVQTAARVQATIDCEELVVETDWSQPDSAGRQYATRIVQTVRRTASTTDNAWQQLLISHAVIAEEARITDSIAAVSDFRATQQTDTTTTISTPAWVNWLVIAVVGAALIVVLLFLRKWRII